MCLVEIAARAGLPNERLRDRLVGNLSGTEIEGVLVIERERLEQMGPDGHIQPRRIVVWRLILYAPEEPQVDNLLEAITKQACALSVRVPGVSLRDGKRLNVEYAIIDRERGVLGWTASAPFSHRVEYTASP